MIESGTPILLTASGTLMTTDCTILGFYVNSTSSGVITFESGAAGASTGTLITGSITPAIGFHRFPASCPNGAYMTKVSGTINVTVFVKPGC